MAVLGRDMSKGAVSQRLPRYSPHVAPIVEQKIMHESLTNENLGPNAL
jgi:hypothetical protein